VSVSLLLRNEYQVHWLVQAELWILSLVNEEFATKTPYQMLIHIEYQITWLLPTFTTKTRSNQMKKVYQPADANLPPVVSCGLYIIRWEQFKLRA